MKNYYVFIILILILSCSKEITEPVNQFPLFNSEDLEFVYSYDGNMDFAYPLRLRVKKSEMLGNKPYYTFYDNGSNPVPPFQYMKEYEMLNYNFLPVRYQGGRYFEYRESFEIVILKDNIKKGDTWFSVFHNGSCLFTYTFKVLDKFSTFNAGGSVYKNVFKIQETIHSKRIGCSDDLTSYHYYNMTNGIIRREIPVYQSGTYVGINFDRVK